MNYYKYMLFIILAGSIIFLFFYFVITIYNKIKLNKILSKPFSEDYIKILENIPFYNKLTKEEKEQIHRSILIFINTKKFIGVKIEIIDEIKIVIAFYACLLVLHARIKTCYEDLEYILVYPYVMISEQIRQNGGIYHKDEFLLAGQSAGDTVVIAWNEAKKDAYHLYKNNVIIHEFAHELDFLTGEANGVPPIGDKYHEWAKIISKEYTKLVDIASKNRNWGKYKLIGDYAATNPAEFFAVITEIYFEKREKFKKDFPGLFKELEYFYNLN
jgi:Mlc titration factor MtfA (ptsG expression regulator)